MSEHFTKNCVAASKYCKKCNAMTLHHVSNGRMTNTCLNENEEMWKAIHKDQKKPVMRAKP